MAVTTWQDVEERLRSLQDHQLRRAVPLAADLGYAPQEILDVLLLDVKIVRAHHEEHGKLPDRVFSEAAARLARLEDAGISLHQLACQQ